ncbi:hypothetical protein FA014_01985 [Cellulomonas hominis]|uniref:Holliday junction resolvase n=1 Tax=Cellulomonas hominis TaxID=156981 RepID=A0A7Z8NR78_9CELL|nr:hypothetical protein [Cellulomonas hominis]TKR27150.1 hypothetical protein FA014_01985 [Cellulomonas hominis]
MANRPKDIGTRAETAVVRAARTRGFPGADRLTLTGAHDRGDIGLAPGVIVEVKGGAAAKDASDGMIASWLAETERERLHAGAAVAFLVTQRAGVGPANANRWWAWWRLGSLPDLAVAPLHDQLVIRMQLADALQLLRGAGYGDPLDAGEASGSPNVPGGVRVQEVA